MKRISLLVLLFTLAVPRAASADEFFIESELIELQGDERVEKAYAVLMDTSQGAEAKKGYNIEREAAVEAVGSGKYRIILSFRQEDVLPKSRYVVFVRLSGGRILSSPTRELVPGQLQEVPGTAKCSDEAQLLSTKTLSSMNEAELQKFVSSKKKEVEARQQVLKRFLDKNRLQTLNQLETRLGLSTRQSLTADASEDELVSRVGRIDSLLNQ